MASFMKLAKEKMIQRDYEQRVRFNVDIDSFKESDALTLEQSRSIIKDNFVNDIKSLIIVLNTNTISLSVGQSLQLTAFLYRGTTSGVNFTPETYGQNVTGTALWIKNPNISTVVTLSRGKVTAAVAGTVEIYAKVGDFESQKITITVV